MSSPNSTERLSQKTCHLFFPSATQISLDALVTKPIQTPVLMRPPHVIDVKKLIEEIFGPECDDEQEEEVDYYQESERLLKYYETHCPRSMAIKAIRENQKYRCGEDYGAGVPCDNTDCFRDYTNNYFQRVLVEEDFYQTLCPDCMPDEEEDHDDQQDHDKQQEHKDKRIKCVVDNDL